MIELFQRSMRDELDDRKRRLGEDIATLSESELHAELGELTDQLIQEFVFPDVPQLLADDLWMEDTAFGEGRNSAVARVHIPFKGGEIMFRLYDGSSPLWSQKFELNENEVVAAYTIHERQISKLRAEVDKDVEFIAKWLESLRPAIPRFNKALSEWVRNAISNRRQRLGASDEATKQLLDQGIPIRKRDDGVEKLVMLVEIERKTVQITSDSNPLKKEMNRVLQMRHYDGNLETISSMVHVIERSPAVFSVMGEEHLRTVLLMALNAIYKGQATGETFNGYGKSDILIRVDDRHVFLAECLVWGGPRGLRRKMDNQLFISYAMWRDTKLALIVFNRNKQFSRVVEEMKTTVKEHQQCVEQLSYEHETGARYKFRRHDDPQQYFTLTCLAFDVPSRKSEPDEG